MSLNTVEAAEPHRPEVAEVGIRPELAVLAGAFHILLVADHILPAVGYNHFVGCIRPELEKADHIVPAAGQVHCIADHILPGPGCTPLIEEHRTVLVTRYHRRLLVGAA